VTADELAQLKQLLVLDDQARTEMADAFYQHKVTVYANTLADLADQHGFDVHGDQVTLTQDVLDALRAEADAHAAIAVDTYNRELDGWLDKQAAAPVEDVLGAYQDWSNARADAKAELISVSEAYSAHADATLAFYVDNGVEPEFDFGGHGDADPRCVVCQALLDHSPHPLSRVLEIGTPHLNCRQSWHALDVDLPDELQLGAAVAGIVGGEPWVHRHDNDHQAAADAISRLSG
jgi:hypothetical protein